MMALYSVITVWDYNKQQRVVREVRRVTENDAIHTNVILVEARDELEAFSKVAAIDNVTVERIIDGIGEWN